MSGTMNVVTGSSALIGQYVSDVFLERGHEILGVDEPADQKRWLEKGIEETAAWFFLHLERAAG